MTHADNDITLKTIMDHLQESQVKNDSRFMRLEDRFDHMEDRMDRMERNLTRQIDAIDQRLDDIEIEMLPKRVAKLEEEVFGKAV